MKTAKPKKSIVDTPPHASRPTSPLHWPSRPKREDTLIARRRVWTSRCKRYRVVHSHILCGEHSKHPLPDLYRAEIFDAERGGWDILANGRHRTKNAAMRHCEQDARGT
jgi:hypothetical protein